MSDVKKIMIAGFKVGLVGLDGAFEQMSGESIDSDDEVARRLLELVAKSNYIPPAREADYRKSLLREYKRSRGEHVPEENGILEVRVYGRGCPRCEKLSNDILAVLAETDISADFEHIRDVNEIAGFGPIGAPTVAINGKVVSSGRVPSRAEIIKWLKEA